MSLSRAFQTIFAGGLYAVFGAFVFSKLKGNPNRWIYILWTVVSAIWFIGSAVLYINAGPRLANLGCKISYTAIVLVPMMMMQFGSTLLDYRIPKRWLIAGYSLAVFFAITVWMDGVFLNGMYVASWGFFPRASYMHAVFMITLIAQTNFSYYKISQKLKDPSLSPTKHEQVRLVRRGLFWYSAAALDCLINYGFHNYSIGPIVSVIGLGHVAYAIFRHQLLDIQIIIRRTLVYSIASTVLTTLYVGILFLTVELLRPFFGGRAWESVIIACFVTAFLHPLIRRIQRPIDRMLGRHRLDHGIELMKFSTELGQDQSAERARNLLGHIIEEAFRPTGFVVYRRTPKGFELFVQSGVSAVPEALEPDNAWVRLFERNAEAQVISGMVLSSKESPDKVFVVRAAAPSMTHKHLQGFVLLGEKRSEEPYTDQDLILLRIVVNQAAGALERPLLIKEVGAGFAHEIKTPLANIAMPAELCVLDLQDLLAKEYADVQDCVPILVKRMEYIVDQALYASNRVDAMQQLSEATSLARLNHVELRELVLRAAKSLADALEQAGVKLDIEVPEEFTIAADEQQIDILVTNLIKNAVEAVAFSTEREVIVRARHKGNHIVLDVEDSGPGIQQKDHSRVFEPYFSTKTGNTRGMGLYIARRIANAHQGTLAYERRGHRTLMRVTFPSAIVQPLEQTAR